MSKFANEAAVVARGLRPGDPMRVLLEYLLQNARGRVNAKTWPAIDRHLRENGVGVSKEQFQQTLLKRTRNGRIFIGSNDHGSGRGYFLIQDREDAAVAREFYTRRIEVQQENLNRLDELIEQTWPGGVSQPTEPPLTELQIVHSE